VVEFLSPVSDSDFVPLVAAVPLFCCVLLHWMVHENVFPFVSLIGMLQVKLSGLPVERFVGVGVPNVGGVFVMFAFVVKVYHFLVYKPLPVGSVAFTQILYIFEYVSPVSDSNFVPLVALVPLLSCPLLHWMVHENVFPLGSLMGMFQDRLNRFPVEPFAGDGVPNIGGVFVTFPFVVKVYHLRVYVPLPVGSVALTQIL